MINDRSSQETIGRDRTTVALGEEVIADAPMILRAMEKGKFVRVNDSFKAMAGFDATELAMKPFLDWIDPCDRTNVQTALGAGRKTFFARHIKRDGSSFPLEIQLTEQQDGLFLLGRCPKDVNQLEPYEERPVDASLVGTLDAIARIIEEQNPGRKCSILLIADGCFVFGAGPSLPEEYNAAINGSAIGPNVGSCGTAIFWNIPVIAEDIQADPLWAELAPLAKQAGVAACWSHPFVSNNGNVLGALALYSPEPCAPTTGQLQKLKAAARMTGLAVERGRAEEELRRSEKTVKAARSQLQAILNTLPDLLFEVDSEGRIFSYHSPRSDLLAAPPEVFMGKRFADVLPQDAADACQRAIDEAAQSGFSYGETYRLALPQGVHWFELSVAPLHVNDQSDPHFIMISRDITERKKAEIALHDAEQNAQYQLTFHRIAAETAAALTTSTSDTEFDTAINQCLQRLGLLFGADRSYVFQFSDDLAYTTNTHEWCADGIAPEMDNLQNLPMDDKSWLTTRLLRDGVLYSRVADLPPEAAAVKAELQRQGIQSFLHATTHGAHGKLAGFIGFDSVRKEHSWRDGELAMLQSIAGVVGSVSVSRQAQSALERKNQEMEQFVYSVSHDLKSPLITVKTFVGMLRQDIKDGDQQRINDDLNYILSSTNKMQQLLDSLVQYSRIGRIDTLAQTVSVDQLVQNCLATLAGILQQHQIQVSTGDLPHQFHGDPLHFGQIWQNLIENAVKYRSNQAQPQIEIGAIQQGQEVVYYVRDNGMGIASEHRERIFNLFSQLNPGSDGSGLGLALVKKIVSIYNGHIWVESAGEGAGSCFMFVLPGALIKGETAI